MDFSKIKAWKIPEGDAVKLTIGGQVVWKVKEPEMPEESASMSIEKFLIAGDGMADVDLTNSSPTSIETDENGDTVYYYQEYGLKIVTDAEDIYSLKKGQSITIYPFEQKGMYKWKYRIVLTTITRGVIYYNGTNTVWTENSIYWDYPPITIEFSEDEFGEGVIDARDKDGDGTTRRNVDFSLGVKIIAM